MSKQHIVSRQQHPHGEQLSAYIDGMLDVGRTRGVAEHLRACLSCRTLAEQLRETQALLRQLPATPSPGPDFWAASYRRLRVSDRQHGLAVRPFWSLGRGPEPAAQRRWAAGLAALAGVCALIAGPLQHAVVGPDRIPAITAASAAQDVSPDVSSLVESHTDSVSRLPLADPDRQKMIAADARQTPPDAAEAAGYADMAF